MTREQYLQQKVAEECLEVAIRCSKAMCFGRDEIQEGQPLTNDERIVYELNDLFAMLEVYFNKPIDQLVSMGMISEKKMKLAKYYQYSLEKGMVIEDNG